MGYAGKLAEKELSRKLREHGLSYNKIKKIVPVSKSTLSLWCRDVILSIKQMERLQQKKLEGAAKGRFVGAKRQQEARIKRTNALFEKGKSEVGQLNKRDRFIAGIALYLGDGYKTPKAVGFANSNPQVISFMMRWLREFCEIPEEKFRGHIWIHDNLDEVKARKFWSKITKIPPNQFVRSYIVKNKTKSKKVRKQIHEHGVFAIQVSSAEVQRKILGWLGGILENDVV